MGPRFAVHDPAKILLDLALGLAVGGDCLADVALLRAEPALFGPVASDPTVSRTIDRLATDAAAVLTAIDAARAAARARAWALAGAHAPDHDTGAANPLPGRHARHRRRARREPDPSAHRAPCVSICASRSPTTSPISTTTPTASSPS